MHRGNSLFQCFEEFQCILRQLVIQLTIVAQIHQQATEEIGAYIVAVDELGAPGIGLFLLGGSLVLDDIHPSGAFQFLAEGFALLIFYGEAILDGINQHTAPVFAAVGLLKVLGHPLVVGAIDLADDLWVLELHQLEERLATLEGDPIDDQCGVGKVAENAPLFVYLMDNGTLVGRVGLKAPILWIELLDEFRYAIETHMMRN